MGGVRKVFQGRKHEKQRKNSSNLKAGGLAKEESRP